jgi:hypothetical protein
VAADAAMLVAGRKPNTINSVAKIFSQYARFFNADPYR